METGGVVSVSVLLKACVWKLWGDLQTLSQVSFFFSFFERECVF